MLHCFSEEDSHPQLTTIPKSYLSLIINLLEIRPQRQQWGQPSATFRLTAVRLPEGEG